MLEGISYSGCPALRQSGGMFDPAAAGMRGSSPAVRCDRVY
jgi:hypothetical protein